jgi:hypothetical protein
MSQLAIVEAQCLTYLIPAAAQDRATVKPYVWHYLPWRLRLAIVGFSQLGIG